ncbi:MAG: hypothetical protein GY805_22320, partial [Chloroflexi bacterium]|nr:hypothetical protein [Chloroflexota bacterium]
VTEGDSGSSNASFTISLDEASSKTITATFTTSAGSATAGTDYVTTSGTVTFNAGSDSETVNILVYGDTVDEDDETFFVDLSNPSNATLDDAQGQATINDDDDSPTISIADAAVAEGDSGTVDVDFTVTLSHASSKTITVNVDSSNGNATAGDDYTAVSTSLTFNPGDSLSQTVSVTINGDKTSEGNETFLLTLSNPTNATLGDGEATGTITGDDGVFIYLPLIIKP